MESDNESGRDSIMSEATTVTNSSNESDNKSDRDSVMSDVTTVTRITNSSNETWQSDNSMWSGSGRISPLSQITMICLCGCEPKNVPLEE